MSLSRPMQLALALALEKRCPKCGSTKPLDAFGRNKNTYDGRQCYCRQCRLTNAAEYERRTQLHASGMWQCTSCGAIKAEAEFYVKKNAGEAPHFTVCRICHNERSREYREAHLEQCRAQARAYHETHRREIIERARNWSLANPERVRVAQAKRRQAKRDENNVYFRAYYAKNRERVSEIKRRSAKKHPEAALNGIHRRHARLRGSDGSWTGQEWRNLKAQYDYRCLCCGKREPEIKLTFDHVIPISMGGPNTIANAQPLCRPCNSAKGTRTTDYRQYSPALNRSDMG